MNSIRSRTSLIVAASVAAILAAGGAGLYLAIRYALSTQFDGAIQARADALESMTHSDGQGVEFDLTVGTTRTSTDAVCGFDFVVWVRDPSTEKWQELARSESLAGSSWPPQAADPLRPGARDLRMANGDDGRSLLIEFVPGREDDEPDIPSSTSIAMPPMVRILLVTSRQPLDRALENVLWSILGIGVLLAGASAAVVWWAVGRGLQPLNHLSETVSTIGPTSLEVRFESAGLPAELSPIADQLTLLVRRLRAAFEREQRFTASASHELRTPIAELRMLIEVAAGRSRTATEWEAVGAKAIGVLDRAQALCESLLTLARMRHSPPPLAAPVLVLPVLCEEADRSHARHRSDPKLLHIDCPANATARIDSAGLATILSNLIDNALHHGQVSSTSPVECRVSMTSAHIDITISNPAPNLGAEDAAHLFEPFWQADAARSGRNGFGLGLALCKTLAEANGGEIHATVSMDHRLAMTVTLPT